MDDQITTILKKPNRFQHVRVRWRVRRDMDKMLEIVDLSPPHTEMPKDELLKLLQQHDAISIVADLNNEVVGYMVYTINNSGIKLLTINVHPDHRRRSVGTQLMVNMIHKVSTYYRDKSVSAIVRESNLPVLQFLKNIGFKATSIKREHFADTGEDGFKMSYSVEQQ